MDRSPQPTTARVGPRQPAAAGLPALGGVIAMRVQSIDRLFDPADPSPLGQQDLSQWASEYIVESLKETESREARELEIIVAAPNHSLSDAAIGAAIREHFRRQAALRRRALRRLLRRGLVMLAIGTAFLATFFAVSRLIARLLGEGPITTLLREGSLIVGWVAMWRPIEIFLYDWWPIKNEQRLYTHLSHIDVRIVALPASPADPSPGTYLLAERAIERWENEGGRTRHVPGPAAGQEFER